MMPVTPMPFNTILVIAPILAVIGYLVSARLSRITVPRGHLCSYCRDTLKPNAHFCSRCGTRQ